MQRRLNRSLLLLARNWISYARPRRMVPPPCPTMHVWKNCSSNSSIRAAPEVVCRDCPDLPQVRAGWRRLYVLEARSRCFPSPHPRTTGHKLTTGTANLRLRGQGVLGAAAWAWSGLAPTPQPLVALKMLLAGLRPTWGWAVREASGGKSLHHATSCRSMTWGRGCKPYFDGICEGGNGRIGSTPQP